MPHNTRTVKAVRRYGMPETALVLCSGLIELLYLHAIMEMLQPVITQYDKAVNAQPSHVQLVLLQNSEWGRKVRRNIVRVLHLSNRHTNRNVNCPAHCIVVWIRQQQTANCINHKSISIYPETTYRMTTQKITSSQYKHNKPDLRSLFETFS